MGDNMHGKAKTASSKRDKCSSATVQRESTLTACRRHSNLDNCSHDGKVIYLYIDEAGNFDFTPKGSKYFILTCAVMERPFCHIKELARVKYDCLELGIRKDKMPKYQEFHANEDPPVLRAAVFDAVRKNCTNLRVYSVIIRKNMTNPALYSPEKIYSRTFEWLTGYVAKCERVSEEDFLVAITDYINFKGKNKLLRDKLDEYMKGRFGSRFRLYQHVSESDFNLQVADYCCWAVQRKWERGDMKPYDLITDMIKGEGDLFKNGDRVYYEYSR